MADDMRPCPFCGSVNVRLEGIEFHWVKCIACDAEGPVRKDEDEAIRQWNERVSRADVLASEGAVMRSMFAPVTPDDRGPILVNVLPEGADHKREHGIDLKVDAETAARIVRAKGLRLLLVEGGE